MKNVMLDLETLGVGNNAAIISIGAVQFDLDAGETGDSFYEKVSPDSCQRFGLDISGSTVLWWMQQSEEARKEFQDGLLDLDIVLDKFSSWFPKGAKIWGNGATFDNVILRNAYNRCKLRAPWHYRDDMCYRTAMNMYKNKNPLKGKTPPERGVKHNALHDAVYQAEYLIEVLK